MKKITLFFALVALSFSAYSQNTCATAQVVTAGTTTVAIIDGTEVPTDCTASGAATAGEWFSYTATADGVVTITSDLPANTGGDTRLHVYSGTCGALTCLVGNDDVAANYLSEVSFAVETGTSYIFAFDDYWEANGFDFQVNLTPITCNYSVPYTETFDDNNQFLICYDKEDGDGDGISWISQQDLDLDGDTVPETFATNGNSTAGAKEDWLFSPALSLTAGTEYTVTSIFNAFSGTGSLEAFIVDAPSSTATQVATLFSNASVTTQGDFATLETMAYQEENNFTPTTSGDYHIAYRSFGAASSGFILLFDSELITTPLSVDEFDSNTITYFYNSNTNSLNLKSSTLAFSNIEVYDILGKQVLNKKLNSNEETINLSATQEGVYIAKVSTNYGTKTIKFVKN